MKRAVRCLAAVLLFGLVAGASPARAAEGSVDIRKIDTANFPIVRLSVQVAGDTPDLNDFHIRENGTLVPDDKITVTPLKRTTSPVGTVLVIDTSGSMQTAAAIERAKAAARQFVEERQPNDWIAVVGFSSQAEVKADFTQDGAVLLSAIDGLKAEGETALWDGIVAGAGLYGKRADLQPNVLVLSDGADTVSASTQAQAVSAITGAHAGLFAIGIQSDDFDPALLDGFVNASRGSLLVSDAPADLTRHFGTVRRAIENQYQVEYESSGEPGALSLSLSVGELQTDIQTRAGTVGVASGPTVVAASDPGLFGSSLGLLLALGLGIPGAGLLGWALMLIFGKTDEIQIENRLAHYDSGLYIGEQDHASSMAETGLVQRAVEMTSKMADRAGVLERVEALLEQANLPLRSAEAMFFYAAGVGLIGILALLTAPSIIVGVIATIVVAVVPVVLVQRMVKKRLRAFEAQLPETLNMLSGSLRAGYSFLQGLEAVAEEAAEPMARELRRVMAETRLGRPADEALEDVAVRMKSKDFEWAVLAIAIQREVGGNLAEVLSTVADTMVQRSRLKGEIKTLTAEGKISGIVMGCLPLAIALYLFAVSPDYIGELFGSIIGWSMVIGSVVMAMAGYAWIQKIIKIEV